MALQIVKKITAKTLGCTKQAILALVTEHEKVPLFRVYGDAEKYEVVPAKDQYKESLRFVGMFEALLPSGETFRSANLFVPEVIAGVIKNQIDNLAENEKCRFAFEIGAISSPGSAVGYEFSVKNLIEPSGKDELALMREEIMAASSLKLPEPSETPKIPLKGKKK